MFRQYNDAGLAVIPSIDGVPVVKWKQYQEVLPGVADAVAWDGKYGIDCTYELVCGKVSGLVALDIDTNDKDIIAKVEAVAGISPVRKFGSKGYTAFYRYNGETSDSWGGAVELLSDKHLCAIPPGKHRNTGNPYVWIDGDLLSGVELPELGKGFIEYMNALHPKPVYESKLRDVAYDGDDTEIDDVANMLNFISADGDRLSWIRIGMALRSEFGDEARPLWHKWSATSAKYKAWDADNAWKSFGNSGVGIATLVWEAKRGGYIRPSNSSKEKEVFVHQPLLFKKQTKKNSWQNAGGMVGAIAKWINDNAIVQQPVYAFATALTIVSIIKAGRIKTTTNLHPNIYTMCLGPTGSGKENNIECLKLLLKALGMDRNIMGRPASGSAIATGLLKSSGVSALCIDELGRYLGGISGKNSQSYQAEIVDVLIDLYSKSGSIFYGKQYANEKQNPQIIIENPYISCIGFTVKERLLEACTGADVLDGFLNRWLIFQTDEMPDESFPENRGLIPSRLIELINDYIDTHQGESHKLVIGGKPWKLYKDYRKMNGERKKAAGWPLDALYQRSQLQVLKLCMIFSDDDNVTAEQMQMAIDVVEESLLQMISFSDSISNTQHEADLLYVLNVINKWPGINTTGLTNKTRKLKAQDRQSILEQLQVMDKIDVQPTSNKKGFLFYPLQS